MGERRTSRPSPAIVVAALALVAALAGTAVAGPDATTSAISKKKVKKIVKKEVAKQIADATGPPGPSGPPGANGATDVVIRVDPTAATVSPGSVNNSLANCVGDERAVGGGALWEEAATAEMPIIQSSPTNSAGGPAGSAPTGWAVTGGNQAGTDKHLRARVVCAAP